jgi:hypothetical protein
MRRTLWTAALVSAALLAASSRSVKASEYPGWGDTGWVYASKRECCKAAIAIAQEYSMEACINVGGLPRPMRGAARGSCEATWTQAPEGGLLYRCVAESSVWCR